MAFCKNCGNEINEGAQFCAKCGTPVSPQPQQGQQYRTAPPINQASDDVNSSRGIAWLSYMGLFFLIPLFVKKSSKYCQFHVKEGVNILAVSLVYNWTLTILMFVLVFAARGGLAVMALFSFLIWAGDMFITVMSIIGIVNAASGKMKKIPVFSLIPWLYPLMDKIYAALNK